jgi:protein SCO1/2
MRRTAIVALAFACSSAGAVGPGPAAKTPPVLDGTGVDQKLDAALPLDLVFVDDAGRTVRLGELFDGERPVLLALVYYRCPMLCSLVLNGLTDAMRELEWTPGGEFRVVVATIDPSEGVDLARAKKAAYVEAYGRAATAGGWHFLTGDAEAIAALADAVGFRYKYIPSEGEYAHPAVQFVITPDGRVSRYLFGVRHEPETVRLSLVEASEGRIGSVVDQFLLYCYRYDAATGRYTPVAWRIMRVGAGLTVVVLGLVLGTWFWREARQRRRHGEAAG